MENQFDATNYPDTEPTGFTVGDRVAWKRTDLSVYDNTLFELSYKALLEGASSSISVTATADGDDYLIEIPSTTTTAYAAGTYHWTAFINRIADSERVEISDGVFVLAENRASSVVDPRSHAKKVLDAIESVIEGRASKDQESLSVEGMSLVRTPIEDLLVLHSKYKAMHVREVRADRISRGLGHSGKILTRFK